MSFISGVRQICDAVLSAFGFEDEPPTPPKKPKVDRDTTKLSPAEKEYVYRGMSDRERCNMGLSRTSDKYITMETVTDLLNKSLSLNKSRQFYSSLYKEMRTLKTIGIDPFQPKQGQ